MNFWDSSACLPLVLREEMSATVHDLYERSETMVIWTLTTVEVASALMRLQRERRLSASAAERAFAVWEGIAVGVHCVSDVATVKHRAVRLLRGHPLKAADALQLAAALVACGDQTTDHVFVTLDARLARAAAQEGFCVLPDGDV